MTFGVRSGWTYWMKEIRMARLEEETNVGAVQAVSMCTVRDSA